MESECFSDDEETKNKKGEPAHQPQEHQDPKPRESSHSRGLSSAPPSRTQAHYRESHASRLRQQLRGMSNTGPFGPPRSKSSSPTPTKMSRRSITSDIYSRSRTASSDKAMDLIQTPRTLSDSSSMRSLTKDTQDILRVITNPPSCCTFDCQSKAVSGVHVGPSSTTSRSSIPESRLSGGSRKKSPYRLSPAADQSKGIKPRGSATTTKNSAASIHDHKPAAGAWKKSCVITVTPDSDSAKTSIKLSNVPSNVPSNVNTNLSAASTENVRPTSRVKSGCIITAANCNAEIGYGKPLVTPVKKKLTIRRDIFQLSHAHINPSVNEKPEKFTPACQRKRSPIRSWRAANSVEPVPKPASAHNKNYSSGNQPSSKCAGKKLRASLTNPNVKADRPATKTPGSAVVQRPMSSIHRRPNDSPNRSFTESDAVISSRGLLPMRTSQKVSNNASNPIKDTTRRLQKDENGHKKYNRDIKLISGRPSTNSQGSKVFKPQLEDIKSSFLLLNKITKARIDGRKTSPIPKPRPYNENERKAILKESKTKFKSKDFWNNASMFMQNQ